MVSAGSNYIKLALIAGCRICHSDVLKYLRPAHLFDERYDDTPDAWSNLPVDYTGHDSSNTTIYGINYKHIIRCTCATRCYDVAPINKHSIRTIATAKHKHNILEKWPTLP